MKKWIIFASLFFVVVLLIFSFVPIKMSVYADKDDTRRYQRIQDEEKGCQGDGSLDTATRVENPAGDVVQYECIKRTVPLTREHVGLMPKRASTSAAGFLQPGSCTKTGLPRGKAFDFKEEIV